MDAFSIRRAGSGDAAGILECLRLAFAAYRDRYTTGAFADTVLSPETIQQRLTDMSLFVAVSLEGEVLGTIGYKIVRGEEGHIRGMAVLPNQLGSSLAQRLLEAAAMEMRDRGCTRMTLDTTEPLERAIRFYERNGFRRSGVIRTFFGMPLIEYVKPLD